MAKSKPHSSKSLFCHGHLSRVCRARLPGRGSSNGRLSGGVSGSFFPLRGRSCIAIDSRGRRDTHLLTQGTLDLVADVNMLLEEQAGIITPLSQALTAKRDPGAGFFEYALIHAQIDEVAFARNAFAVEDVEFGFAERCGNFVLHDFGACARTDDAI